MKIDDVIDMLLELRIKVGNIDVHFCEKKGGPVPDPKHFPGTIKKIGAQGNENGGRPPGDGKTPRQ